MFPGAQHLQNLHPLVIHFPLALLMGAALLYVATWLLKREGLAHAAFVVLVLGAFAPRSGLCLSKSSRGRENTPICPAA